MKWNLYSHFVSGLEFGRIFQRDKFELVPYGFREKVPFPFEISPFENLRYRSRAGEACF
jgi:hypothetical protein